MNELITTVLIVGASVSSGFSGKPSGEWIAEWMNVPYRNEAQICQGMIELGFIYMTPSLIINGISHS